MQIIINIDEYDYKNLMLYRNHPVGLHWLEQKVITGTPLPKGHGRLIDADVLCDYFWDNRSKLYTHKDLQIVIDNIPTIIEADKKGDIYAD